MTIAKQARYLNGSDLGRTITFELVFSYRHPVRLTGVVTSLTHYATGETTIVYDRDGVLTSDTIKSDQPVHMTGTPRKETP